MADRRRVHNDRAARLLADRSAAQSFWPLFKGRYSDEAQAAGDQALDELRWDDLRAIEVAEMVMMERLMSQSESHRARAVLRNTTKVSRRTLAMIALAERPALDIGSSLVPIPQSMLVDAGYPKLERAARQADRRARVERRKVEILDSIGRREPQPNNRLAKLERSPEEELLRLRRNALQSRRQAELQAQEARVALAAQMEAGEVVYGEDDLFAGFDFIDE